MLFIALNVQSKFIEYYKILNFLKIYLLVIISIFIFYNNPINTIYWVKHQVLIFAGVVILWTIILALLKKKINFKLNLTSKFFEILLIVSVIIFGIKSFITFYILLLAMFDFLYILTLLSVTNHFNKKHNY